MSKNPNSSKNKGNFIEITEFRAIGTDELQWIIYKRGKLESGVGYSDWRSYSYHSELEGAANSLKRDMLRLAGSTSFRALVKAAEEIRALMDSKLSVDIDVVLGIKK